MDGFHQIQLVSQLSLTMHVQRHIRILYWELLLQAVQSRDEVHLVRIRILGSFPFMSPTPSMLVCPLFLLWHHILVRPAWCGSMGGTTACELNGHLGYQEALIDVPFPLSLPPFPSL